MSFSLANLLIDPIHINNETPLLRMISLQTGTRVQAFTDAVRSRDRQCVITRRVAINADDDDWTGFEAAHIFPLAYEQYWQEFNYGRWIKSPSNGEEIKGGKINSVQNGLLLSSDIHQLFDTYQFSINPDVCINTFLIFFVTANNYLRTITRLYTFVLMGMALLGISSIKDLSMILKDQLTSFYVGISDRRF
jgi:hypothetical protein